MKYVIIIAKGEGTRLKKYTRNKPKILLPVDSKPLLFHFIDFFKSKKIIVLEREGRNLTEKYTKNFLEEKTNIHFVYAEPTQNTTGLKKALELIPENEPFITTWSDLYLDKNLDFNVKKNENYIGLSEKFFCRWKYENGIFTHQKTIENGVAGFFIWKNKKELKDVPEDVSFVSGYLKNAKKIFKPFYLKNSLEFGDKDFYEQYLASKPKCRAFNKIEINSEKKRLTKKPANAYGEKLAIIESAWYQYLQEKKQTDFIPKIYEYKPLKMDLIAGAEIALQKFSLEEKKFVLRNIIAQLKILHKIEKIKANAKDLKKEYIEKTLARIEKVKTLIPFSSEKNIHINQKTCKNVFFHLEAFEKLFEELSTENFYFYHGDPTFSNILYDPNRSKVYFIDPRGYFGNTKLYGDKDYDFAKLYYSLMGNYDNFNKKKFELEILDDEVLLEIEKNDWQDMGDYFFQQVGEEKRRKIKILHAIIWLSLSSYCWEDYDQICGAFYQGCYLLNDFI